MKIICLLAAAIAPLLTAPAFAVEWATNEFGEMAFVPMGYAPYPHVDRQSGHTYQDKVFSYQDSYSDPTVALFIPNGYTPDESTELIFYWHGWGNSVRESLEQFDLAEQVTNSGKNIILVFPEGPKNASDSHAGKIEDEGGLARLAEEVMITLRRAEKIPDYSELGAVILSGHSGAYRAMGLSLRHGGLEDQIREVYLLDASYALYDDFALWVSRNPDARLLSIYTDHLLEDNEEIMALLGNERTSFLRTTHETATAEDLQGHRAVFLHTTTLDHNGAVSRLESFLASSALPEIPTPEAQ